MKAKKEDQRIIHEGDKAACQKQSEKEIEQDDEQMSSGPGFGF